MSRVFFLQIGLFQVFALSVVLLTADAREAHDRPSADRMVSRQHQTVSQDGTLHCKNATQNTGQACELMFKTHQTHRIYALTGEKNSAMRLYLDGKREVSVLGSARGHYLRVEKIKAL